MLCAMKHSLVLVVCCGLPAAFANAETIRNRSLVLQWDGQSGQLASTSGVEVTARDIGLLWPVAQIENRNIDDSRFGAGKALLLRHENGWKTTLSLFDSSPFLHCTTVVKHRGDEPHVSNRFVSLTWFPELGVPLADIRVIGTGGLTTVDRAAGSYAFSILADPESRRGIVAGWLTHRQGIGLFFPEPAHAGRPRVRSEIEFGRFQVESGASRETETLLVGLFDDCRLGIEAYADAVVTNEAIQLKPKQNVYCTWYHAGASNETKLTENTRFAAKMLRPFGLSVMQIDDLWQTPLPKNKEFAIEAGAIEKHGPYKVFTDANDKYPNGMAAMADEIRRQGMTSGIWFMPFAGNHHNPYFDDAIFASTTTEHPTTMRSPSGRGRALT